MLYKLTRAYWDGKRLHKPGSIMNFSEGTAPKTALPYEEPVPEPKSAAKPKSN